MKKNTKATAPSTILPIKQEGSAYIPTWKRGNATSEVDYERRLLLAYDILLSYPADGGTLGPDHVEANRESNR